MKLILLIFNLNYKFGCSLKETRKSLSDAK